MIETHRLLLKPFCHQDIDSLRAYYQLEQVARYLYWEAMDDSGVLEALNKKVSQTSIHKDGDVLCLAV